MLERFEWFLMCIDARSREWDNEGRVIRIEMCLVQMLNLKSPGLIEMSAL